MIRPIFDRRTLLGGVAGLAAWRGVGRARAAIPPALPSSPVALNVIDVAGQLQLTQAAMEAFARANPKLVSKIAFSQAPAPELPIEKGRPGPGLLANVAVSKYCDGLPLYRKC